MSNLVREISKDTFQGLILFSRGLPINLVAIPLAYAIMIPNKTNLLYAVGGFLTLFFGIILHDTEFKYEGKLPKVFLGKFISLYGLTLGYFSGYILLKAIYNKKIGNLLSTFVTTIILCILLSWTLYHDNMDKVPQEIASSLAGVCVGGFIGMYFYHLDYNLKKEAQKDEIEKNTEVVCRTYQDGLMVDEQRTSSD